MSRCDGGIGDGPLGPPQSRLSPAGDGCGGHAGPAVSGGDVGFAPRLGRVVASVVVLANTALCNCGGLLLMVLRLSSNTAEALIERRSSPAG